MYDIIMFRQTIFVINENTSIYGFHTCSFHTALVARDSVEGKYNTVHQYSTSTATTIEMRAFL